MFVTNKIIYNFDYIRWQCCFKRSLKSSFKWRFHAKNINITKSRQELITVKVLMKFDDKLPFWLYEMFWFILKLFKIVWKKLTLVKKRWTSGSFHALKVAVTEPPIMAIVGKLASSDQNTDSCPSFKVISCCLWE